VTVADEYDDVLAIDMGARWVATCAFLSDRKTTFYGEKIHRTREHYKQLRKSIGKAKPRGGQQVIKRVGDVEARKVDDRLHKISRRIVEDAERRNAVIVVGDLGRIHEDNDKGRYVNDKTHKMPSRSCSTTSSTKPTTQASMYSCSTSTTRHRCVTAVRARAPVRHRDASSVPSVGWMTTPTRTVR
jgi:IS605 OrfB family transposase